jgi:hypothetical protein
MNDYLLRVRQAKLCHKDEEGDPRAALFVTYHAQRILDPLRYLGFPSPDSVFPAAEP